MGSGARPQRYPFLPRLNKMAIRQTSSPQGFGGQNQLVQNIRRSVFWQRPEQPRLYPLATNPTVRTTTGLDAFTCRTTGATGCRTGSPPGELPLGPLPSSVAHHQRNGLTCTEGSAGRDRSFDAGNRRGNEIHGAYVKFH